VTLKSLFTFTPFVGRIASQVPTRQGPGMQQWPSGRFGHCLSVVERNAGDGNYFLSEAWMTMVDP